MVAEKALVVDLVLADEFALEGVFQEEGVRHGFLMGRSRCYLIGRSWAVICNDV